MPLSFELVVAKVHVVARVASIVTMHAVLASKRRDGVGGAWWLSGVHSEHPPSVKGVIRMSLSFLRRFTAAVAAAVTGVVFTAAETVVL